MTARDRKRIRLLKMCLVWYEPHAGGLHEQISMSNQTGKTSMSQKAILGVGHKGNNMTARQLFCVVKTAIYTGLTSNWKFMENEQLWIDRRQCKQHCPARRQTRYMQDIWWSLKKMDTDWIYVVLHIKWYIDDHTKISHCLGEQDIH